jgi:glycosidase
MRFTDNHDERRAIARFGERAALAASALVFTMDGAPMLYNGMEVGDTTESGAPALFEKLPVFWQIGERRQEFPRFYKQIIALRRQYAALRQGTTEWLKNSDEARIVTYMRREEDQEVLVTINLSNHPFVGFVEVAAGAKFLEITPYLGSSTEARPQPVGLPALALDAWGYRIFRRSAR